ncbi:hypothetical protein [uncultured Parasutterella sp.]|uniref:hypothetical protein n=1 Tax=uncultured Parasutterella sp. TaxID=1263098 RepID=UPI00272C6705|nr:hypothetical protein [uncultured Parasutterella sp.]
MALEGIINEQEFFSQHYLDENLQQEIAPWAKEQEDKEKEARSAFEKSAAANAGQKADYLRTPWAQLSSSAGRILKRMQEAVEIADASVRVKAVEEITKELCGIFELPNGNKEDISADGVPVPLYAKKSHAGGGISLEFLINP